MNVVLKSRLGILATRLGKSKVAPSVIACAPPYTIHPRSFSVSRSTMAALNVEIPSLKLNDGSSIPLVGLHQPRISICLTDHCSLAMAVGDPIHHRDITLDFLNPLAKFEVSVNMTSQLAPPGTSQALVVLIGSWSTPPRQQSSLATTTWTVPRCTTLKKNLA